VVFDTPSSDDTCVYEVFVKHTYLPLPSYEINGAKHSLTEVKEANNV